MIRMNKGGPLTQPLGRCAKERQEPLIHELDLAVGIHRIDHGWNGLEDEAKIPFALTQRFLRALSFIDIRLQDVPMDDAAGQVSYGETLHLEPAVDAVRAPLSVFIGEWLAGLD